MTLLTPAEVAKIAGCDERTVRRACVRGEIRAERHGSRWIITRRAVDAWVRPPLGRPRKA